AFAAEFGTSARKAPRKAADGPRRAPAASLTARRERSLAGRHDHAAARYPAAAEGLSPAVVRLCATVTQTTGDGPMNAREGTQAEAPVPGENGAGAGGHRLECFFDCSSPWTYLCFHNLPAVAARAGVQVRWRPILVGGVFNAVNPSVYAARENPVPAKQAYMVKSMADWARLAGIEIRFPPPVFPVKIGRAHV